MKKALTLILTIAFALGVAAPALAVSEVYLEGEDVYGGNINNGATMGGTENDNAADLQPGEKLSFILPADLTEGEYTVEVRTTGNRTDYNVYVGDTLAATVKRPEGSGWGFDVMTTDAATANIQLKPGDTIAVEAPDNGEYGWVDWVKLTLVNAAQPTAPAEPAAPANNPKTGDFGFIWLAIALLGAASVTSVFLVKAKKKS
ncbi:MAG: LPXTG cell wall anchor domain-containing protein [Oscillospiraceae bacterium]|jgi:LPXTG-motif cell wall-anchored protein|nr:LPXTG cell wall anchor domain-containing protein [Oscillospiraceae bacterium]